MPDAGWPKQVEAIDVLDKAWVVDEHVVYTQATNSCDAVCVPAGTALLFCWGTHAPWQQYLRKFRGNILLVFSGVDGRVRGGGSGWMNPRIYTRTHRRTHAHTMAMTLG